MRLFIELTGIDISKIIENEDYVPAMEQPVPQVAADPDQPSFMIVRMMPRN